VGFETTISAVERPQTYALDRVATGTNLLNIYTYIIILSVSSWKRSSSVDAEIRLWAEDRRIVVLFYE